MTIALIAVDIQFDFLPGGALGVASGNEVIPTTAAAAETADVVVATRDWHPSNHCSFVEQGGVWPPHCVQGTHGGEIHPTIESLADIVVSKATTVEVDAYSGFGGEVVIEKHPDTQLVGSTARLSDILFDLGVTELVVTGLATDYCVKATALDGKDASFNVKVIADAVRAVDVQKGDGEQALRDLQNKEIEIVR